MMHFHQVTDRERDTILAALRLWQRFLAWRKKLRRRGETPDGDEFIDIAAENGDILQPADIDKLCDELNCGVPVRDIYECVHCGASGLCDDGEDVMHHDAVELDDNGATAIATCRECGGRAILAFGLYGVTKL